MQMLQFDYDPLRFSVSMGFSIILLSLGILSIKAEPYSRAQQLAAGWFISPLVGSTSILYNLPEKKAVSWLLLTPLSSPLMKYTLLMSITIGLLMMIWSFALAIRHSRLEIKEGGQVGNRKGGKHKEIDQTIL